MRYTVMRRSYPLYDLEIPECSSAPPYELYDEQKARELVNRARKLVDFAERNLI